MVEAGYGVVLRTDEGRSGVLLRRTDSVRDETRGNEEEVVEYAVLCRA